MGSKQHILTWIFGIAGSAGIIYTLAYGVYLLVVRMFQALNID